MRTSDRTTARLVGWLFIGTFVFSIPGFLLYGPLLDHPKYVLGGGHDAGQTLAAFHDWTFLLGPGFCAGIGNGLLLGYIMYTSGLLPRRIAVLGLVGGTLAFVAATGALLGIYQRQSAPQFLLTVPEIIWELTFGVYLVTKGFMSSARRQDADVRRATAPAAALV